MVQVDPSAKAGSVEALANSNKLKARQPGDEVPLKSNPIDSPSIGENRPSEDAVQIQISARAKEQSAQK